MKLFVKFFLDALFSYLGVFVFFFSLFSFLDVSSTNSDEAGEACVPSPGSSPHPSLR